MINIYPFKSIMPSKEQNPIIHDSFVSYSDKKIDFKNDAYEQKLIYVNDLLKKNLLYRHQKESFYCCKISNEFYSVIGVVALINASSLGKNIFKHERCIILKEKIYADLFKKHNTQISPIILIHEDNAPINRNIENLVNSHVPFITIKDNATKYEIWTIESINKYKELYSTIDYCFIADGHHRMAAANLLNIDDNLVTAFLTSVCYIKTSAIRREYKVVDGLSKEHLRLFLRENFNLIKINNNISTCIKNFFFKIDHNLYEVKNLNNKDNLRRDILEFLDQSINYNNGMVNFYNYPFRNNKEFIDSTNDLSLLIPALNIRSKIGYSDLYPPHSTMFYPKIPEGLINYKL